MICAFVVHRPGAEDDYLIRRNKVGKMPQTEKLMLNKGYKISNKAGENNRVKTAE